VHRAGKPRRHRTCACPRPSTQLIGADAAYNLVAVAASVEALATVATRRLRAKDTFTE
jgi:hypothetical protein